MKAINRIRNIFEKAIDYATMTVLIGLLIVSLYAILDVHRVNTGAILDEQTAKLEPDDETYLQKLKELQKLNPEIIAWLKIDDTHINQPVVQTKDNNKYLTRNHLGNYSTSGAAFVDYRNTNFPDDYSVIYGHRMTKGLMFSDVTNFKQKQYFDSHQTGKLYTLDGIYKLKVILFAVPDLNQTSIYNVGSLRKNQNSSVLNELSSIAVHANNLENLASDKLLLLSTCDQDAKHYRDVLLFQMIRK